MDRARVLKEAGNKLVDSLFLRVALVLIVCWLGVPGRHLAAQGVKAEAKQGAKQGAKPEAKGARPGTPTLTIPASTARAVEKGLSYLAMHQNPDGSWTDRVGRKVHMTYRGTVAPHVGVTGLVGIAFLAHGVLPGQGSAGFVMKNGRKISYCDVLEKALEYVMSRVSAANGFISANGSRMYSHAFATLFLAEVYGTGSYRDAEKVRRSLKNAIRLIVNAQNAEGGWRYRPGAQDSDMSITVCQVMALRAARNAGVEVPLGTIQRAVNYVKKSFVPGVGAFTYQLGLEFRGVHSRWTPALTAAGVTTLYSAGEYDAFQINEGLRYILRERPMRGEARYTFDYYYFQYYAVQAAFQKGGAYWERWYDSIRQDLLLLQESDGRWTDLVGANYATAMASIILQYPNQYLPITEN
ncbi:MAG: prenyltransferase/squalene oxidase repeat-containing protein [Planctomycetota bacterium]|nr:prenyltransferase/squalene oxidase repeat-containing protein [Planctomycetota bacterium]